MASDDNYTPSFIVWALGRWANDMWVRFGGRGVSVYLVGSSLHRADHKDIDVVIVLPDEVFRNRYGMTEPEWMAEEARFEGNTGVYKVTEWCPAHRRWAREVGGLVPGLCEKLKEYGPPDLKVQSEGWQGQVASVKPRVRLDTVDPPG